MTDLQLTFHLNLRHSRIHTRTTRLLVYQIEAGALNVICFYFREEHTQRDVRVLLERKLDRIAQAAKIQIEPLLFMALSLAHIISD